MSVCPNCKRKVKLRNRKKVKSVWRCKVCPPSLEEEGLRQVRRRLSVVGYVDAPYEVAPGVPRSLKRLKQYIKRGIIDELSTSNNSA